MTHPSLNDAKVSLAQYQQELLDCDRIIAALPGYRKWFRFTYLREGNTSDPVYRLAPSRDVPGQSLLLSMARSLGMGTADIGPRLMDDGDFEIELLKQKGL